MKPGKAGGHAAGVPLGRERIVVLLAELDHRLRARGVGSVLYVVGGAAVAVTVADRRVTRDVDVAALDKVLTEEARRLAVEERLPADWLNAAAAPWIPAPPEFAAVPPVGLAVQYAPPEHLLAMKMVALRQQDADDIAALAAVLGMTGVPAEQFAGLLYDAYAGEGVLGQVLGVPEDRVEAEVEAISRRVAAFLAYERPS